MPKAAKKLTKPDLESLRKQTQADPKFTAYVADAGQPGLYAWARRGRVRFVFAYRPPGGGARRRMKIDDYGAIPLERAREIAQGLRGLVAGRVDPQKALAEEQRRAEEEQRRAKTVADAVADYLAEFKERAESGNAKRGKRSGYASARNRLERHVVQRFGSRPISNVTSEHVLQMKHEMSATPVEFNRTRTAFSAVFGFAARKETVPRGFNPVLTVEEYEETGTRRNLTADEMTALGIALIEAEATGGVRLPQKGNKELKLCAINPKAVLAIRLLALTGFRRGEVLGHTMKERRGKREGLRWGDVDLEAGIIHLHDSKTGPQRRVVGAAAVKLLSAARPDDAKDEDPVCPGTLPGAPLTGIDKPRKRLWQAAGLTNSDKGRVDLHSLRHSFATTGAHVQQGKFIGMVGPLLGHGYTGKKSITDTYIHRNPEALRPAADAIAGEIARLLGLVEPGRVLAFTL